MFSEMLALQANAGGAHPAVYASKQTLAVDLVEMDIAFGLADEGCLAGKAVEPVSDAGGDVRLGFPVSLEPVVFVDG